MKLVNSISSLLTFCSLNVSDFLLPILVTMFDWQAEMSSLAIAPKVARVIPPPDQTVLPSVSFAQALTTSTKMAPNANLPKPKILGETLSKKIIQDIYERGMNFGKTNLRGRLVSNKGEKPYSTKEIESKLQKQCKTA